MYHMGATVTISEDDPRADDLWADVLGIACKSFGLCASVGCGCVVDGAEVIHTEVYSGTKFKVAASEGPTWLTIAYKLPYSVSFDFFFDEDAPPTREAKLAVTKALHAYDLSIFWRQTTDHYSPAMRGQ